MESKNDKQRVNLKDRQVTAKDSRYTLKWNVFIEPWKKFRLSLSELSHFAPLCWNFFPKASNSVVYDYLECDLEAIL